MFLDSWQKGNCSSTEAADLGSRAEVMMVLKVHKLAGSAQWFRHLPKVIYICCSVLEQQLHGEVQHQLN